MKTTKLSLALAMLLVPTLAASQVIKRQPDIPHVRAQYAGCSTSNEGQVKVIVDATSAVDCDVTPEGDVGAWVKAFCWCSDGALQPLYDIYTDADLPAASTTVDGIVELATHGEIAASLAVQSDDYRVNGTRVVKVRAGATDVTGKLYNTIKEAADYVATQTHNASNRWQILVEGGGSFTESPFTISSHTDLVCTVGGGIYAFGDATTITAEVEADTFITLDGGGIRNCAIEMTGAATSERRAIDCTGGTAGSGDGCNLDHVGILVWNLSGTAETQAYRNSTGTSELYYVSIAFLGLNTSSVGVKNLAGGSGIQLSNGYFADGGYSQGKAIWQLSTTSGGVINVQNVRIGSVYNDGLFATDIVNGGSQAVNLVDTYFRTNSGAGAINVRSARDYGLRSAPPNTCAAGTEGSTYTDSDIHKRCICNGTNYVLMNDDTTTTGCS